MNQIFPCDFFPRRFVQNFFLVQVSVRKWMNQIFFPRRSVQLCWTFFQVGSKKIVKFFLSFPSGSGWTRFLRAFFSTEVRAATLNFFRTWFKKNFHNFSKFSGWKWMKWDSCVCVFYPWFWSIFFFCSSLRQDVDEPDSCVCFFSTEVCAATLSFFELGSKIFFIIFQSFLAGSRWSEILVYVFFTRDFDQFFFVVQFFFFSFPAGCGWTEIFPCAFYPQSSV